VDSASQTVTGFNSKLSTLQTAAKALYSKEGFTGLSASSSDSAIVATAAGGATAGAYSINVTSLAKEQRTYSNAMTSNTSALGMSGSFSIAVGTGTPASVSVAATDSLADIATKVNALGIRATASVIYDGTNYYLQVRGADTGSANSLTFDESALTVPGGSTALGLSDLANRKQAAANASITLDGITISRATNQFNDVIPGVSLAVTKETTSPVTVKLAADPSSIQTKIQAFVTAYNDVINTEHSITGFGDSKPQNPNLASDNTLRTVTGRLSSSMSGNITGTTGLYTTLASVGITTNRDGTLAFDTAKFATALNADSTAVSKLFVYDLASSSTGVMKKIADTASDMSIGLVSSRIEGLSSKSRRMQDEADRMQKRLDALEDNLRKQFTNLETIVNKYKGAMGSLSSTPAASTSNSK
jgi:flagellar hook-associated protein 2